MTDHRDEPDDETGDDPDLRSLLDSLGIREERPDAAPMNRNGDLEPAAAMLARIVAKPKDVPRRGQPPARRPVASRWRGAYLAVAGLTAVIVAIVWVVFTPGTRITPMATAQTPAVLRFSQVRSGQVPASGAPAAAPLDRLAAAATSSASSAPSSLPVQHLEIDAWYSSTDPAGPGAPARSVLIPTHRDSYLSPDGTLRAVERRGPPLDADGRVSRLPGGWDRQPVVSDETTDTDRPADYPDTLPRQLGKLGRVLAPPADCADTRGGCLLSAVTDLYSNFVVPPDLAGALWRLLADEPTVTFLGTTTDRVNRPALAFTAASLTEGQQLVVLADPATGAYLGAETILVAPSPDLGFRPPAVIEFSSLLTAERIAAGPR